jgi:hypothetical protein
MYTAKQRHKCAFVGLCMHDKFTLTHGVQHTNATKFSPVRYSAVKSVKSPTTVQPSLNRRT